ncbi:inositol monophosphatase family protein [Demequina sp. NBRC 110057]|uniref:inositol monophosphatase family protein n=1 Tax=Demequina sp. NBRC 110057 TaxID=1570346 RepID=UPI000A003021|nr:inositol monophosphatase family protein [Demequina sp. NBRC 110057]
MSYESVETVMRRVADELIRPRFRSLSEGEIDTKSGPNDLVTIADIESERALTPLLREIEDIAVVGEEATEKDPSLTDLLATEPAAWTVDPVDGTWNFAHGKVDYAVMVARVVSGEAADGWILHPETGDLFGARRGEGAWVVRGADAAREPLPSHAAGARPLEQLRGVAISRFLPGGLAEGVAGLNEDVAEVVPPRMCAGWDYWDLATGALDFLLWSRAKPWDHAPGVAIVRELGYAARYLDGTDYRPDRESQPFLVARESEWQAVADRIAARTAAAS